MALYKVNIRLEKLVTIPVSAPTLDSARSYVNNHESEIRDFIDYDQEMCEVARRSKVEVLSIKRVEEPRNSPFKAETICWNEDEQPITAAQAFYGDFLNFTGKTDDDDRMIAELFDLQRKAK